MKETRFTLVTGGLESRGAGSRPALDGIVVRAAFQALSSIGTEARSRIVTILPASEVPGFTRVEIGQIVRVPHADLRMRRNSMVLKSDAVVIISGDQGTKDIADLAYIAGKPVIFVPFTGGVASECWDKYRLDVITRLNLTDIEIASLEAPKRHSDAVQVCLDVLMRALRPRCFVAMPYSGHPQENVLGTIRSVAEDAGYEVIRIDQETFIGDIVDAIWDGIRNSDIVIADLTNNNPNVFYELGISQAMNKAALLVVYSERGEVPSNTPFDVASQRILAYDSADSLRRLLRRHLPSASISRTIAVAGIVP
jgi:hypothetical protein